MVVNNDLDFTLLVGFGSEAASDRGPDRHQRMH